MEVKSVYMDLQEWVKKGNVWKLESEAFKKPIEIKIWYDNKELAQFRWEVEWLKKYADDKFALIEKHDALVDNTGKLYHKNLDYIKEVEHKLWETDYKLSQKSSDLTELYKVVADLKWTVEMQSGTILKLQEQVKLLEKKITKQPMVFHDKWFISWRESSGLWMINIPDGDYLMIMNTKVGEHNEYVTNKDELIMEKIHVEGQHYVPFYKLEWGTELDTPTATIYYDLVFIPM